MAFVFKFPDVGEGIHEGRVVEWLVAEGDAYSENQLADSKETYSLASYGEVIHVTRQLIAGTHADGHDHQVGVDGLLAIENEIDIADFFDRMARLLIFNAQTE